jgi:hypothetical protein
MILFKNVHLAGKITGPIALTIRDNIVCDLFNYFLRMSFKTVEAFVSKILLKKSRGYVLLSFLPIIPKHQLCETKLMFNPSHMIHKISRSGSSLIYVMDICWVFCIEEFQGLKIACRKYHA